MNGNLNDAPKWWFPRKASGFGWGLPSTWQGWTWFSVCLTLIGLGGPTAFLALGTSAAIFVIAGVAILLIIVIVIKGEPLGRESVDGQQIGGDSPMTLRKYKTGSCLISTIVILASVPLLLKWVPKNGLYGFRVHSTITGSSAHWLYVNQLAGAAEIAAGTLSIVFALLVVDRVRASNENKARAVLTVTIVLLLAGMIPPFLAR